jgi:hypothetical protein
LTKVIVKLFEQLDIGSDNGQKDFKAFQHAIERSFATTSTNKWSEIEQWSRYPTPFEQEWSSMVVVSEWTNMSRHFWTKTTTSRLVVVVVVVVASVGREIRDKKAAIEMYAKLNFGHLEESLRCLVTKCDNWYGLFSFFDCFSLRSWLSAFRFG